ncbi:MFS transporter [Rossellomorea marisflavi]|uniref:MFS transporter n=1 Tax=Rossellomorea marisflavi TaxID=189381 RepID=UPI00345AB878
MAESSKKENNVSLMRNKNVLLLWSAQSISTAGDDFFNIAIMWAVYSQSGSTLQSAMIGVIWHISDILFGPIAGVFADNWNRKKIMLYTNILSAFTTICMACVTLVLDHIPLTVALVGIFLLNCFTSFLNPARASVLPDIVNKNQLTQTNGIFSTIVRISSLIGNSTAGFIIGAFGITWAILGNSISFFIVALLISLLKIPKKEISPEIYTGNRKNILKEIREGWKVISDNPKIKVVVYLSLFLNIASFLGPLYPALIVNNLSGGASIYGVVQASGLVGGVLAGVLIGKIERKLGAGKVLIYSWVLASISIFIMGFSHNVYLTLIFAFVQFLGITTGSICLSTIVIAVAPENYRGRITGITRSLSVLLIPITTLLAGLLGKYTEISTIFAIGGLFVLLPAIIAASNSNLRNIVIR